MNNTLYLVILIITDLIAFYISFALAYITRLGLNLIFAGLPIFDIPMSFFIRQIWIPLILLSLLWYQGLYIKRQNFWLDAKDITKSVLFSLIIVLAVITLSKMTDEISRLFVLLMFVYCLFITPLTRLFVKKILHLRGFATQKVVLICPMEDVNNLSQLIEGDKYLGFQIGAIFSNERAEISIDGRIVKIYKSTKWLKRIAQIISAQTAFVSFRNEMASEVNIRQIQMMIKKIYVIPDIDLITHLKTEIIPLLRDDLPLLFIKNNLKEPVNTILKGIFDYIFTILLFPFFIPLILLSAVLIKIDSRGPVFFKQKRVGKGGKEFEVYKFRTMYLDNQSRLDKYLKANPEAREQMEMFCKLKDDPRVTPIGRLLRKTSIDELPQLINVLKGEMSLVGPRPAFKEELSNYYRDLADFYKEVKPGITGLWQVSGRNQLTMKDRARLEAFYVINWSLWFDIVILFKTIKVVLKKEGAY